MVYYRHRVYTPGREKAQILCAIGSSKCALKVSRGSWKDKTVAFLDAMEMFRHNVRQSRGLEAKVKAGGEGGREDWNVVLWPREELRFEGYDGWADHWGAAVLLEMR